MEDFFLKNSKKMSNENITMRKAALSTRASKLHACGGYRSSLKWLTLGCCLTRGCDPLGG